MQTIFSKKEIKFWNNFKIILGFLNYFKEVSLLVKNKKDEGTVKKWPHPDVEKHHVTAYRDK